MLSKISFHVHFKLCNIFIFGMAYTTRFSFSLFNGSKIMSNFETTYNMRRHNLLSLRQVSST